MKMNTKIFTLFITALAMFLNLQTTTAAPSSADLIITHTPVNWGVTGQPLTLKARVSGGVGGVKNVTLYYALFRDAAPFRVNMASSGIGLYVGTIEAGLLSGVSSLSYYIEAEDKGGTIEETPWYDVSFKDPTAAQGSHAKVAPTGTKAAAGEEGSSMTVGLIAGGAAAIAVGAYVISDSGGDDSSSGNDGNVLEGRDKAGTYTGTANTCVTIPPAAMECTESSISIFIDQNGKVFSDTLLPGQQLTGTLNGGSFTLQGNTSNPAENLTGNITFTGNFIGNSEIDGTISGNLTSDGSPGTYSGDFTATK